MILYTHTNIYIYYIYIERERGRREKVCSIERENMIALGGLSEGTMGRQEKEREC
jgi:hypothetical protein